MASKNHEPTVVVTTLENGMTGVFVPLRGNVAVPPEAYGDNAQLFLVENPSDALRPPTLRVNKNLDPRVIMAKMASNPRATLTLV